MRIPTSWRGGLLATVAVASLAATLWLVLPWMMITPGPLALSALAGGITVALIAAYSSAVALLDVPVGEVRRGASKGVQD